MGKNYIQMPRTEVQINAQSVIGHFEGWRHTVGHGGVNSQPLPEKIIAGTRKLRPRLIRIFLQEYFDIYPDHDVFNWSKLDPYLGSFAQTGAKILATINFKPPVLYPQINHNIWRPSNVNEWQNVIYQLVRRYSVEQPIVTYWEHVNEPDIGTWGGCPYRIPSVEELHEFYKMTMQPVLQAFPGAKIGGPCPAEYQVVSGFVDICAQNQTQLDFVSYHRYQDDPEIFRFMAETLSEKIENYPGKRPELMINEWNKGFEPLWTSTDYDSISVEEMAMQSRRAAHTAKIILTMLDTPLDWSFYFLLWDSCMHPQEFVHFFSPEDAQAIMYKHWNEAPHRFGLFSESGKPRPQYFVYQILSRMGEERIASTQNSPDLTLLAVRGNGKLSVLVINFDLHVSQDKIVKLRFNQLSPGAKRLTAYRIDEDCHWSSEDMELLPYEQRLVDTLPVFEYQFYSPADSVLLVTLEESW
jgi:xylan 1,4-beta-xylosidase